MPNLFKKSWTVSILRPTLSRFAKNKKSSVYWLSAHQFTIQCVIINKSDDKKTVRSRVEDSAVDY